MTNDERNSTGSRSPAGSAASHRGAKEVTTSSRQTRPGAAALSCRRAAGGPSSILDIDFLPVEYAQRSAAQKKRLWQLTIVLIFGGIIAASAVTQFGMRTTARQRIVALAGPYARAQAQLEHLDRMQTQLHVAEQTAALYVYLRHPWPKTQILRAVVVPLPASIELDELQIGLEVSAPDATVHATEQPGRRSPGIQEEDELTRLPPERDLDELRDHYDRRRTVIQLTGVTGSTSDLHTYLAEVVKSPVIHEAELRSLESTGEHVKSGSSRFAIRLVAGAGFGQPEGPRGPSTAREAIVATPPQRKETDG